MHNFLGIDIADYQNTMLNVSSILLGLVFTAFIFILQKDFRNFCPEKRSSLIKLNRYSAKISLYTLGYIFLASLFHKYLTNNIMFYVTLHIVIEITFVIMYYKYQKIFQQFNELNLKIPLPKPLEYLRMCFHKLISLYTLKKLCLWINIVLTCILLSVPIFIAIYDYSSDSFYISSTGIFLIVSVIYIIIFIPDYLFKIAIYEQSTTNKK